LKSQRDCRKRLIIIGLGVSMQKRNRKKRRMNRKKQRMNRKK
jgi:hypothetical protein